MDVQFDHGYVLTSDKVVIDNFSHVNIKIIENYCKSIVHKFSINYFEIQPEVT